MRKKVGRGLNVYLTDDIYTYLLWLSEKKKETMSKLIREAVENYYKEDMEKFYSQMDKKMKEILTKGYITD